MFKFGVSWKGGWRKCLVALGIASVSLVFAGVSWGGAYDPALDSYSMYNLTAQLGVPAWWNAGYTGQGVDVAVIDTGVAPVEGLNSPGKVVYGPDLSLESQDPSLTNLDTNGHGTFMAGLIAGHDPSLTAPYSSAPASAYRGIAPDARIVSLKVADADGGVDVTQVIAAIDWVVQHAHDPGFNIRVINLSYGTLSTQPYTVDPLAYAVEQAWKHGIVVVAAAGNTGSAPGNGRGLSDPAYDPYALAVGAYNTMGTASLRDDVVASYSARSNGCGPCRNPDLVAPGTHMQGLRVPGSYIDQNNPAGVIDGRYFRGSGTSEAAAITSGIVALLLQKYPDLSPDEVKKMLMDSAQNIPGWDNHYQGSGAISLAALAKASDPNGAGPFCVGFFSGPKSSIEVPAGSTCTLTSAASVATDVNVDPGGTLVDQGAQIGHDIHADYAAGITISGGSIGHDIQVQNATGPVSIIGASIGHDLVVQNNQGTVTVNGNSVGHTSQVQSNGPAGPGPGGLGGPGGPGGPGPGPGPGGPGPGGPAPSGPDAQNFPLSNGLGSLDISRGGDYLSRNGVQLAGNEDIFGDPLNLSALAQAEASASSWSGGVWDGSTWTGSSWSGSSWSGSSWSGSSWSGSSWSGSSWSGSSWSGSSWSGSSWSGDAWSGDVWAGVGWN